MVFLELDSILHTYSIQHTFFYSMAETGRRKLRIFQSLLYKAEAEETDHFVQSLAGAPVPSYEVSCPG